MRFNEMTSQWEHPKELEDARVAIADSDLPPSLRAELSTLRCRLAEAEKVIESARVVERLYEESKARLAEAERAAGDYQVQLTAMSYDLTHAQAALGRARELLREARDWMGHRLADEPRRDLYGLYRELHAFLAPAPNTTKPTTEDPT